MKTLMLAAGMAALLFAGVAQARDVYVDGYTKRDGTYVQPHHRTSPDSNPYNNYEYRGNPYTGRMPSLPSTNLPRLPRLGGGLSNSDD